MAAFFAKIRDKLFRKQFRIYFIEVACFLIALALFSFWRTAWIPFLAWGGIIIRHGAGLQPVHELWRRYMSAWEARKLKQVSRFIDREMERVHKKMLRATGTPKPFKTKLKAKDKVATPKAKPKGKGKSKSTVMNKAKEQPKTIATAKTKITGTTAATAKVKAPIKKVNALKPSPRKGVRKA